jgi:hypothetical protein
LDSQNLRVFSETFAMSVPQLASAFTLPAQPMLLANSLTLPMPSGGLGGAEFLQGLRAEALRGGGKAAAEFITRHLGSARALLATREGRIAMVVATTSFVVGYQVGSSWNTVQAKAAALKLVSERQLAPAALALEVVKILSPSPLPVIPAAGGNAEAQARQQAVQPLKASIEQTQSRLVETLALQASMGSRADDSLQVQVKALQTKLQDLLSKVPPASQLQRQVPSVTQASPPTQQVRPQVQAQTPPLSSRTERPLSPDMPVLKMPNAQQQAAEQARRLEGIAQQEKAGFLARLNDQSQRNQNANNATLSNWVSSEPPQRLAERVQDMQSVLRGPSMGNVYANHQFANGKRPTQAQQADYNQYQYGGALLTGGDLKALIRGLQGYLVQLQRAEKAAQVRTPVLASTPTAAQVPAAATQLALQHLSDALRPVMGAGATADPGARAALVGRALEQAAAQYPGATLRERIENLFGALGMGRDMIWLDPKNRSLIPSHLAIGGGGAGGGNATGGTGGTPGGSPEPEKKPGFVENLIKGLAISTALSATAGALGAPAWLQVAIDWWPFDGDGAARVASKADDLVRLGSKADDVARLGTRVLRAGENLSDDGAEIIMKNGQRVSVKARELELGIGADGRLSSKGQGQVDALEEAVGDFKRTFDDDLVKVGKLNINAKVAEERLEAHFKTTYKNLAEEAIEKGQTRAQFKANTSGTVDRYVERQLGAKGTGDASLQQFRERIRAELQSELFEISGSVPSSHTPVKFAPKPLPSLRDLADAEKTLDEIPGVDVSNLRYDPVRRVITGNVQPDASPWHNVPLLGKKTLDEKQLQNIEAALKGMERNRFTTIPDLPIQLTPGKDVSLPRPLYQPQPLAQPPKLKTTTPEAIQNGNFSRPSNRPTPKAGQPGGQTPNVSDVPGGTKGPGQIRPPGDEQGGQLVPIRTSPNVSPSLDRRLLGRVPVSEAERAQVVEQLMAYGTKGAPHYRVAEVAPRLRQDLIERLGESGYRQVDAQGRSWSRLSDSDLVALDVYLDAGNIELNTARRQQLDVDNFFWRSDYLNMGDPTAPKLGTSDGQHVRLALQTGEIARSAMDKLPKFQGTVYRGLNLPAAELAKHTTGSVISYPAFTSTAAEQGAAFNHHQVLLKIQSKSGADLRALNPHEAEILFPPNSQFRVLNRRNLPDGKVEIHLQQLR